MLTTAARPQDKLAALVNTPKVAPVMVITLFITAVVLLAGFAVKLGPLIRANGAASCDHTEPSLASDQPGRARTAMPPMWGRVVAAMSRG